jgi:hypothetical protein
MRNIIFKFIFLAIFIDKSIPRSSFNTRTSPYDSSLLSKPSVQPRGQHLYLKVSKSKRSSTPVGLTLLAKYWLSIHSWLFFIPNNAMLTFFWFLAIGQNCLSYVKLSFQISICHTSQTVCPTVEEKFIDLMEDINLAINGNFSQGL